MPDIIIPKSITNTKIEDYLSSISEIFQNTDKHIPNIHLRFDKVIRISLLGQLLMFKTLEYGARNGCFEDAELSMSEELKREVKSTGIHRLLDDYLKGKLKDWFGKDTRLKHEYTDRFFIEPFRINRSEKADRGLSECLERVSDFYSQEDITISAIAKVLSELYSNFWEHATDDSGTIMGAKGSQESVEMVFVDTGQGILTSLRDVYNQTMCTLSQAVSKGITSKPGTNHMGYGLWHIREICKANKGWFQIFSEGRMYTLTNTGEAEKKCPYWHGTIVRVEMNPQNMQLPKSESVANRLSKIRWE